MQLDGIEFHNVAEYRAGDNGLLLQRVPERVRTELNEGAQTRMRHPAGVELRFVSEGAVEVTLSTVPQRGVEESVVRVFWGPLQSRKTFVIGPEPTTIELSFPERLADIASDELSRLAYDPRVCRIVLPGEHRGGHVRYHGIKGDVRPPIDEEVPDLRYLAYGT